MTRVGEFDVLVVGFGAAGASAAIAAHDAGARVAIVEKTAAGGGNCRHSGGFLVDLDGPTAVEHLDSLCFGKTDRDVLAAYVAGLGVLEEWLDCLGGETAPVDEAAFGGMLPSWPHFPGSGHVRYRQFVPPGAEPPGASLWNLLEDGVRRRGIPVSCACAAVELALEDGEVTGAVVKNGGRPEPVRAGSVVLASGGFEYSDELRDTYLPLPLVPVGHPGNTGDTLRLAAQADASLWHMSAFFGWFAYSHPDFPAGFTLDVHAPSFIYVDGDGRRFADETGWEVHDKVRAATAYLPRHRNRPRMPGHLIFDEQPAAPGHCTGWWGRPMTTPGAQTTPPSSPADGSTVATRRPSSPAPPASIRRC